MTDRPSHDPSGPLPPGVESRPGLLRALGPGMALAMVVGNVIGSGIFLMPGLIASQAGSFPLILAAWIVGGGVCILGGLCFAELAVMLPRAGGLYVYLREAYGRPVGFLFGWSEFVFGRPASIGALSVAFSGALATAVDLQLGTFGSIALTLGLIAVMAGVNILGVIWGGRVQAGTTLIKAGFLGAMGLLPFVLLLFGLPGVGAENYASTAPVADESAAVRFAAAMLAVMWAYNGWHGVTPVAEEVRNPNRNLPLALFGGIGLLILLYVLANCAYHGVLSMGEMAEARNAAAQTMIGKLLAPAGEGAARLGVAAMSAVIMCSTFGAINTNIMNGPRVAFAMGRDRTFFESLGDVHVNYRTPVVAIVVMAIMSALLVIGAAVYGEYAADSSSETVLAPLAQVFETLTSFVIYSATIFYMLAVLAVIVLRLRHPDWERPYRTLGYPVVPLAYLAFYTWFLYRVFFQRTFEAGTGIGLILLGLPVYAAYQMWLSRSRPA